ncbi:hypothetical protein KSK55_10310 [Methanospirillum purgamenti]|uniref:Uncharacterized protein n=1 Tax=Methanospirillum hungatei TaxID=2203 RepID=A0A8F5ZDW2_METHU|nr:hypothetical protein [Methanospirillum hungatei]QXO93745.1 hypothetical protein KSK55_10310 [Methanospirillum hungatei]
MDFMLISTIESIGPSSSRSPDPVIGKISLRILVLVALESVLLATNTLHKKIIIRTQIQN